MTAIMNHFLLLVALLPSAFVFSTAHAQSEFLLDTSSSSYPRDIGYTDIQFLSTRSSSKDLDRRNAGLYGFDSDIFRRVVTTNKVPPTIPTKPEGLKAPSSKQNPGVAPPVAKSATSKSNGPAASLGNSRQTKITEYMKPAKPKDKITNYFKPIGKTTSGKLSSVASGSGRQPKSQAAVQLLDTYTMSKTGQKLGEDSSQAASSNQPSSLHRSDSASSIHRFQLHDEPVPTTGSGLHRSNAITAPLGQGRFRLQRTNSASLIPSNRHDEHHEQEQHHEQHGNDEHVVSSAFPTKEGGAGLPNSKPSVGSAEKKPGIFSKMKSGVSNIFKAQTRKDFERLYPNVNPELHALPEDQQKNIIEDFRLHNGVAPDQIQYEMFKDQRSDGWFSRNKMTIAKSDGEKKIWDNKVKVPVFIAQMASGATAPFPKLPIRRRSLEIGSVHYRKRALLIQRELYWRMLEEEIWG